MLFTLCTISKSRIVTSVLKFCRIWGSFIFYVLSSLNLKHAKSKFWMIRLVFKWAGQIIKRCICILSIFYVMKCGIYWIYVKLKVVKSILIIYKFFTLIIFIYFILFFKLVNNIYTIYRPLNTYRTCHKFFIIMHYISAFFHKEFKLFFNILSLYILIIMFIL